MLRDDSGLAHQPPPSGSALQQRELQARLQQARAQVVWLEQQLAGLQQPDGMTGTCAEDIGFPLPIAAG